MRDALDSWHMGRVIAACRNHPLHDRPLPQELVAGWFGITQAQLSRVENGPPIKDLDKLIHWARTIGIPASLLWFKLPGSQGSGTLHHSREAAGERLASEPRRHPDESHGSIAVLVGLLDDRISLPESASELVDSGANRNGPSLRETAGLILGIFLQLDDELGGDTLYPSLSSYVRRLARTVDSEKAADLSAFGQLAQMTGWLALDSNQHPAARRYLTAAVHAGHEADDPALAASSLAYLSLQETYRSRPGVALALAQTASEIDDGRLTPLTRTMLGTRLARARAGLRQNEACLRALDEVREAFCDADSRDEPLWLSYVDDIEVAAQEGACYLDLGMTAAAAVALTDALDLLTKRAPHRQRDRVHYLARLAKCHLIDHEVEQACVIATEALSLSDTVGSIRVVTRLKEFHDALAPFHNSAAARDFRERFTAAMVNRRRKATHERRPRP